MGCAGPTFEQVGCAGPTFESAARALLMNRSAVRLLQPLRGCICFCGSRCAAPPIFGEAAARPPYFGGPAARPPWSPAHFSCLKRPRLDTNAHVCYAAPRPKNLLLRRAAPQKFTAAPRRVPFLGKIERGAPRRAQKFDFCSPRLRKAGARRAAPRHLQKSCRAAPRRGRAAPRRALGGSAAAHLC